MPTSKKEEDDVHIIICGDRKIQDEAIPIKCHKCDCDLFAGTFAQKIIAEKKAKPVCASCAPLNEAGGIQVLPEQIDERNKALGGPHTKEELELLGNLILNAHIEKDGVPCRTKDLVEITDYIKSNKFILKEDTFHYKEKDWNIRTVFLLVPIKEGDKIAFYRSEVTHDNDGFAKLADTREEALSNHQDALNMLATAKMAADGGHSIH